MRGAVQVVAFDEPELSSTLDAWADQRVPSGVDVTYEAWITPAVEPRTQDPTWRQAADHPVFEPFETPPYKLPSRNVAHETAISRGDDFFIVGDADAPPLTENVLTALTRPLTDREVVCVCSNPVASVRRPAGAWANLGVYVKEAAAGGIHGQCHLVTARGWRAAGPFEEALDHTNIKEVWPEEEYAFGQRLRDHGRVKYAGRAKVRNDTRRLECSWRRALGLPVDDYCAKPAGSDTFAPRSTVTTLAEVFDYGRLR